jgi:hypothetical protein
MVLAVWARPGLAPKGRLFHFVLTPALVTSAIGLPLFYGVIEALIVQQIGTITPHIPQEQLMQIYAAVVPVARTTLTTFLVCCGLLLVVFVEPPIAVGLVAATLAAWLLLVRWLWRTRAIDLFLGRA